MAKSLPTHTWRDTNDYWVMVGNTASRRGQKIARSRSYTLGLVHENVA